MAKPLNLTAQLNSLEVAMLADNVPVMQRICRLYSQAALLFENHPNLTNADCREFYDWQRRLLDQARIGTDNPELTAKQLGKLGEGVCNNFNEPGDPHMVYCPVCGSAPGESCRASNGASCELHPERIDRATGGAPRPPDRPTQEQCEDARRSSVDLWSRLSPLLREAQEAHASHRELERLNAEGEEIVRQYLVELIFERGAVCTMCGGRLNIGSLGNFVCVSCDARWRRDR